MYSYVYITTNASNTVLYTGAQGSARAMRSRLKPGMTRRVVLQQNPIYKAHIFVIPASRQSNFREYAQAIKLRY